MKLLVDIGNSAVKWACLQGGEFIQHGRQDHHGHDLQEQLKECWQAIPAPENIYVANVAGDSAADQIAKFVRQCWGITAEFAQTERQLCGVANAYQDIEQLGVDRWLALVAAWHDYHEAVLVVGCGTAVTLDVVDVSGQHIGGLIIPGHTLMQQVLVNSTHGIKSDISTTLSLGLGKSTAACINKGAAYSIVSLIERVTIDIKETTGDSLTGIITGGYAAGINTFLSPKFHHDPSLVLRGLALWADERL